MDLSDNPIPASEELSFPSQSSSASETDNIKPVELEVTGIGGVWPADNFAIAVRSCHVAVEDATKHDQTISKIIPPKFAKLLDSERAQRPATPLHQHRVISLRRKDLPPSELPPALNFMSADDGSDEDESGGEDESDELRWERPISDGCGPSAALQPLHAPYGSSDDEDEDEDMDDNDDDSRIDMLATARQIDPEGIRRMELAYDAGVAERLAEEIPAGSSAATAGGGSGNNSPVHVKSPSSSAADAKMKQAGRKVKNQASTATATMTSSS
jgi:hypothetical protein